jgi:complex III assembly factor LYRM7
MAVSLRGQVLGGFRRLMRARGALFKDDVEALTESRYKLREEFFKNEEASGDQIDEHLKIIEEIDTMLRQNIVQAKLNERGNYGENTMYYLRMLVSHFFLHSYLRTEMKFGREHSEHMKGCVQPH